MPKFQYNGINFFYHFIVEQRHIIVYILITKLNPLKAIFGLNIH